MREGGKEGGWGEGTDGNRRHLGNRADLSVWRFPIYHSPTIRSTLLCCFFPPGHTEEHPSHYAWPPPPTLHYPSNYYQLVTKRPRPLHNYANSLAQLRGILQSLQFHLLNYQATCYGLGKILQALGIQYCTELI